MRENENNFILFIFIIECVLNFVFVNYFCGKIRRDLWNIIVKFFGFLGICIFFKDLIVLMLL